MTLPASLNRDRLVTVGLIIILGTVFSVANECFTESIFLKGSTKHGLIFGAVCMYYYSSLTVMLT